MADYARVKLLTPKARLSYPVLFRAKAIEEGKTPTFSAALIFDLDAQNTPEFKAMQAQAKAAAVAKWGDKIPGSMRSPFRKAEEKGTVGYEPGYVFINVSSQNKPGIVQNTPAGFQPIIDENDVYPGMYVVVSVSAYAYDQKGNKGVSFGLNNVLKVADGDALGGGRSDAGSDFAGLAGQSPEALF